MKTKNKLTFNEIMCQCIIDIKEKYGAFTPKRLVTEAKNTHHPLHKYFDWDINKAAEKYWLVQARLLIQRYLEVNPNDTSVKVRGLISIMKDEDGNLTDNFFSKGEKIYETINDAMNDTKLREYVLKRAMNELRAFERKYNNLIEFAQVIDAIHNLENSEINLENVVV